MKPKLLFWIDQGLFHYGLAKFIQENLDCEILNDKLNYDGIKSYQYL